MEITRADPGHEPQILALAQMALRWGDDQRYQDLYRWKHDENPFGASSRWVALEGGQVVGFRVFLNWRFRRSDGSNAWAVRAVDTATHPDHQGKGIFRALTTGSLEELRAMGVDFVFNTPNDQSRPGYLKMGWIELGRPPVAMTPRPSPASVIRVARSRTSAERWSLPTDVGRPAADLTADPEELSRLLALVPSRPGRWSTDRDVSWFGWRYGLSHLHYRVLTTGDLGPPSSRERGAAVFRIRRRGRALEATIALLMIADPEVGRRLVREVLRATGADYALSAGSGRWGSSPSISLPAFSPLVTWRAVSQTRPASLGDFDFAVGDLELF